MKAIFFYILLLISAAQAATPRVASIAQIIQGELNGELVCVSGMIVDSFQDETDDAFQRLLLFDRGDLIDVACAKEKFPPHLLSRLIDAHVSITGHPSCEARGLRKHLLPFISNVLKIDVLKAAPPNGDFDAPPLKPIGRIGSLEIKRLGRRIVTGKVIAAWQGNSLLIDAPNCGKIRILLARSAQTPQVGDDITVVGIATTDSVDFILKCAHWRKAPTTTCPNFKPKDITPDILGGYWAHSNFSRETVRVRGRVVHTALQNSINSHLLLECGHHTIRIDPGNLPNAFHGIETGSEIEVTGIGFCRIDPDTFDLPFARFKEYLLVIRSPDDVRILANPPWWTPGRMSVTICILLFVLAGIAVWNKVLHRLVTHRSRQLAAEQLARAKAVLKFDERTRLAVELHDSLSQALTGAAMEIKAANTLKGDASQEMVYHLVSAERTLQSCRDELRNCLWDLRSQTLEAPDMTTAILRTLEPHMTASRLTVRFNVARTLFTDNTTHTVLRIIRELVLNAIRHGQATAIRVAGILDGDILNFSVTDNGCGFDPNDCPSIRQGHFGLQGIRERIRPFGGKLKITREKNKLTKATVSMRMSAYKN